MRVTDWITAQIADERQRQDEKWGQQDHPDVDPVLTGRPGGCTPLRMAQEYEIPTATRAKQLVDFAARKGEQSFAGILIEEVAEAVEAATLGDTENTVTELIQCAAVIQQWIEAIGRRGDV